LIATSPHAYFVFDNHDIPYQSVEKYGLDKAVALSAIRRELKPSRIGFFDDHLFNPQQNQFVQLLRSQRDDRIVAFPGVTVVASPIKQSWLRTWTRKRARLYYLFETMRTRGIVSAFYLFLYQLRTKPVLLLGSGYNWNYCHIALYQKGYSIWGQVNVDLDGDQTAEEALMILNKKKFKAVLFSVNASAASKAFAVAARERGIPVIGWQHGDLNYIPAEQVARDDLENADLFLNWGVGSQENLVAAGKRCGLERQQQAVGSSYLDHLRIGIVPHSTVTVAPTIVYATTMYYLSGQIAISDVPWSDFRTYQAQRVIIKHLADLPGKKIVKCHPSVRYHVPGLFDYCRSFAPRGLEEVHSPVVRATDLFKKADLIIIDVPSTTLVEAAMFDTPIFCLLGQVKLSDKAVNLLKKRAMVSDDPEILMDAVENYLETGEYLADSKNNEFVEAYGTQSGFMASGRAAEEVHKFIS